MFFLVNVYSLNDSKPPQLEVQILATFSFEVSVDVFAKNHGTRAAPNFGDLCLMRLLFLSRRIRNKAPFVCDFIGNLYILLFATLRLLNLGGISCSVNPSTG